MEDDRSLQLGVLQQWWSKDIFHYSATPALAPFHPRLPQCLHPTAPLAPLLSGKEIPVQWSIHRETFGIRSVSLSLFYL